MGQLIGNLTNAGVMNPSTGQTAFFPSQGAAGQGMAQIAGQQVQPATSSLPNSLNDPSAPQFNQPAPAAPPQMVKPTFAQAAGVGAPVPGSVNAMSPALTKGGKLMALLMGGLQGALSGVAGNAQTYAQTGRNAGFGGGMAAGYTEQLPFLKAYQQQNLQRGGLENQMLQNQVTYAPLLQRLNILKTSADIGKTQADTGLASAQAGAIPTKQALEQAQAEAANYKDDPNLGLIDLRTKQPVSTAGLAPLSADEAAILGKQPGDTVPLKIKNTANEMVNRGFHTMQAGGRSLVVDSKGNTVQDKGPATPMVVANYNNPFAQPGAFPVGTGDAVLKGLTPQQQTLVKGVANYSIDPNSLVSQRGRGKADLLGLVKQYDPNYDETQYGVKSDLRKSFTSGADAQNVQALNTVAHHLNLLDQANDALNNGNLQVLNQIANAYKVKAGGDSAPVVFGAIKNAVSGELGNVFKKSGATDPEIASIGSTISDSFSKGITKNVIGADVGLVQGRLKALQFKYENGMGKPADFKIISPEAEQTFNRLGGVQSGGQGGPPTGASHAVVVNGKTVGYTSDGKTMTPAP